MPAGFRFSKKPPTPGHLKTVQDHEKPTTTTNNFKQTFKTAKNFENPSIGFWIVPIGPPKHAKRTSLGPTSIPIPTQAWNNKPEEANEDRGDDGNSKDCGIAVIAYP